MCGIASVVVFVSLEAPQHRSHFTVLLPRCQIVDLLLVVGDDKRFYRFNRQENAASAAETGQGAQQPAGQSPQGKYFAVQGRRKPCVEEAQMALLGFEMLLGEGPYDIVTGNSEDAPVNPYRTGFTGMI